MSTDDVYVHIQSGLRVRVEKQPANGVFTHPHTLSREPLRAGDVICTPLPGQAMHDHEVKEYPFVVGRQAFDRYYEKEQERPVGYDTPVDGGNLPVRPAKSNPARS